MPDTDSVTESASLPVNIRLHEGVSERIITWFHAVQEQRLQTQNATSYEDLMSRQRECLESTFELLSCLVRLLRTTEYDGEQLHIAPEFLSTGLEFRYEKSGFHGGLIVREHAGRPTWSIHT